MSEQDEEGTPEQVSHIVQTFPKISRRPSTYKLFEYQKEKNQNKPNDINELNVMIKQLDQEKFHPRKVKKEIIKRSNPQID